MNLANLAPQVREQPLAPLGLIAQEQVAIKLAHRLLKSPNLDKLRGVYFSSGLILLADQDYLPWVAGVDYIGKGQVNLKHFYHCLYACNIHDALIDGALSHQYKQYPLYYDCRDHSIYDLSQANAVDSACIQEFLRGTT